MITTGEMHSIREFTTLAFKKVRIPLEWEWKMINEKGINSDNRKTLIEIDPKYFRSTEVDLLLRVRTKAKKKLGLKPKI